MLAGVGRYGWVLLSTVLSLGLQGIAPPGALQQVAVTALAVAAVVLALHAAPLPPRLVAWATAAALVLLALSVVQAVFGGIGEGAARAMNAALVALGPPAIAYGVLHDLRTTRHVGLQSVLGVLSLYILLGMLFAFVYGAIDLLADEPFFAGVETATVSECLYFSFITLTTVGYGDLSASSDLGHTLSIFEALLGQIYLVTVVSVLVSNVGRPPGADRAAA
jgi:Ion channel